MEGAQSGDTHAFERLVLHYRAPATRFAHSFVHDAFHAEDIAQESFAKVWLHLSSFKAGTSFKSWLFTIIRNKCIDHARTQKPLYALPEGWDPPGGDEPEAALAQKELWRKVKAHWAALPEATRTALYLFAAEGLSYNDIARVLGKNPIQIKTMIYRGRQKLKREGANTHDG